jgi:hypothetical protein
MTSIVLTTFTDPQQAPSFGVWPPLTTMFTPPPSCTTKWLEVTWRTAHIFSGSTSDFGAGIPADYWRVCNPYSQDSNSKYSPGICPYGLTAGTITGSVLDALSLTSKMTWWFATCCPRSVKLSMVHLICPIIYVIVSGLHPSSVNCIGNITKPITAIKLTVVSIDQRNTRLWDTYYTTRDGESAVKTIFISEQAVHTDGVAEARPVHIVWQSSDLSDFPSAYATSLAAVIGVPFGPATPASSSAIPQPTQSAQPASPINTNLSTGTKVGIGIGAALGVFLLGGSAIAILLRRRKKKTSIHCW